MQSRRKKIRMAFWIVIILGSALLGVCAAAFQWEGRHRNLILAGWLTLVVVAALIMDLAWYRWLGNQVDSLLPLLHTDPDRYIDKLNRLLAGSKSLNIQHTRAINLAAAYSEKKDYRTAERLLAGMDPRRLPPQQRSVYWADLALIRFHRGKSESACDIIREQTQLFAAQKHSSQLGGLLAVLSVYYAEATGDKQLAWERLHLARGAWKSASIRKELDEVEEYLRQK